VVEQHALVLVRVTMRVTQHGPFVVHAFTDGFVTDVFASRGPHRRRSDALVRVIDGRVPVHDAVRDDLGMAGSSGFRRVRPTCCAWG
jgi:hypothetical protein